MKCQNRKADVLTLFQFCHTCGNPLHDEAQSSGERPARPPKRKAPPTFNEFRKKLSPQRQEGAAKDKTVPAKDVLLNIGVMKLVKGTLKPVKGKIMMVRVPVCIRKLELLNKGIEKHSAHDRSFDRFASYALVYPDGTEVLTLPGQPTQLFQLDKYKEDIGKPYNRITLYLVEREMLEMNREDQSDSDLDREEDSFTQTTLTDIYTSVNVSSPDEQQQCSPSRTIGESTNVNRAAIVQNLKMSISPEILHFYMNLGSAMNNLQKKKISSEAFLYFFYAVKDEKKAPFSASGADHDRARSFNQEPEL